MRLSLILLFFCLANFLYSQNTGIIRGSVFEDSNGEPIIGANIFIPGTTTGTITDLDGAFALEVEAGTHTIQISYITFQTITIEGVVVKNKEVTIFDNIRLQEDNVELSEVIVTAEVVRNTESALNTLKKKSTVMMDGISASKIKLIGDGTAVEAAKRITGVSIEGGKYVYVRGLGDRYSKTTLNGMDIPGLDPDKNTLQMDIFPTNLIDNILVSKNFTADMPADFTGGLLNVETKDFPESKFIQVSASLSYNPEMHFNSDHLAYQGGNTDFMGFDDGTRALPAKARRSNIPTPISGDSPQDVNNFIRSFNPELGASRQMSFMDFGAGFSMGNQIDLKKSTAKDGSEKSPKLGYIFSLSYKSESRFYDEVNNSEYQRFVDPSKYDMRYATIQEGEMGENSVLIGTLAGLAYKTERSKIRLTAMHLQNGESRAARFNIINDGEAIGQSGYVAESDNLEYNQRGLSNVLLNGTHLLKDKNWEIDWRISPTYSSSEDPDIRKTAFTQSAVDTLFSAGAGGNPARIWRSLQEFNLAGRLDLTKKYRMLNSDAKLKFGFSNTYKVRDYEILFFDIQFFGNQDWPNPDPSTVLNPENIFPSNTNNIYYQSGNGNPNPNAYSSNVQNTAVYFSNEFEPLPNLKTILGLRAENYVQRHTGRDQRYASGDIVNGRNLDNEKVLESLDLFPSVNLIYSLSSEQNLRAGYSRTIARPSFKELSFAQILDPISNRIFNGSLFTYGDWNGQLQQTDIDNLDLRWELFMRDGQILSASLFYKNFKNPIELVRIPEQQTSTEFQPRNVGNGTLYGFEIEANKNLGFLDPAFQYFSLSGNFTYVESQIDMTDVEFNARKNWEREGETTENTRSMAGQAPWVINLGATYNNAASGWNAGLFYNVKGSTLSIVGLGLFPDIYLEPFHSLNFSINKQLGANKRTTIDFRASNILDAKVKSVYRSYNAQDELFSLLNPGRGFSLGMSHKF